MNDETLYIPVSANMGGMAVRHMIEEVERRMAAGEQISASTLSGTADRKLQNTNQNRNQMKHTAM